MWPLVVTWFHNSVISLQAVHLHKAPTKCFEVFEINITQAFSYNHSKKMSKILKKLCFLNGKLKGLTNYS